jgi:hypothetical protein
VTERTRWVTERTISHGVSTRRFSPPWTIDEMNACFIVRDRNGQALGYFYFEESRDDDLFRLTKPEALFEQ